MHVSEGSFDAIPSRKPLFSHIAEGFGGIAKSNTLTPEDRESRIRQMELNVENSLTPGGEQLPDGVTAKIRTVKCPVSQNDIVVGVSYSDDNSKVEYTPEAVIRVDESDFR